LYAPKNSQLAQNERTYPQKQLSDVEDNIRNMFNILESVIESHKLLNERVADLLK